MTLKEWFDQRLAKYLNDILGFQDVTVIREPKNANPPPKGWHYIVVNMEKITTDHGHPVMPGELPRTFSSIDEAINEVVCLSMRYDHNVETARIFQLYQMDLKEMHALFDRAYDEYMATDLGQEADSDE